MSDSLIAFHPAIEDPSNIRPSAKASSLICDTSIVRCCNFPRGSVKRRSTYFTSFSLMSFSTASASFGLAIFIPLVGLVVLRRLERVRAGFAGADPDRLVDGRNEDLAVTDASGARRILDRFHRLVDELVGEDDLDLNLGQEVDDIFGAAIELGMAFLPAETLGLGNGNALQSHFLQGLFDFVELERLDDGLDLFHAHP